MSKRAAAQTQERARMVVPWRENSCGRGVGVDSGVPDDRRSTPAELRMRPESNLAA